jgi:hypothetical protein
LDSASDEIGGLRRMEYDKVDGKDPSGGAGLREMLDCGKKI